MTTERHVLDLLRRRYSQVNMGTTPRYLIAEQPNYMRAGWSQRRADAIVLDRNGTTDYSQPKEDRTPYYKAVHGFEVKCSRADWLAELADPEKAATWGRFCHHWWLAVSDPDIVRAGELPDGWGLLVPRGIRLTAKIKAPYRPADPLDHEAVLALTLAAVRTDRRHLNHPGETP